MFFVQKIRFALILLIIFSGTVFLYSAENFKGVRVINTTDIHGELESKADSGAARLATIIKDIRGKAGGQNNVLLIDCGDLLQGSYAATLDKGESMVDFLNLLAYDVWVPGNHDFDFGTDVFLKRVGKFKGSVIAANLDFADGTKCPPNLKKWETFNRNGLKIAVIGMTSPYLDTWLWGPQIENITAKPIRGALEKILPEIMESKPDVIVLAVHNGEFTASRLKTADDQMDDELGKIARMYPQINMIAGGHSHQECPGKQIGIRTWFVQSPPHAEGLLVCDISYDLAQKRVANISSFVFYAKGQEEDSETAAIFEKIRKLAETEGGKVIAEIKYNLAPLKKKETSNELTSLFGAVLCESAGASFAFHGTLSGYTAYSGNLTERQLFMLAPYENPVVILKLSPSECKAIIEEQLGDRKRTVFQSVYGMNYHADNAMKIIQPLRIGSSGQEWISEDVRVKAALAGYYAAGAGGRFPELKRISGSQKTEAAYGGMGVRDALRAYLKKHYPFRDEK